MNKKHRVRRVLTIAFYALGISGAVLFPFGNELLHLGWQPSWSIWRLDKNYYPLDFPHLVAPVAVLLLLLAFACWQVRASKRRKLRRHDTSEGVKKTARERQRR